jgi:hypothetical protein
MNKNNLETPLLKGIKRSSFNFMKIEIYADRFEAKNMFLPKKIIPRSEIISWTEVNKKLRNNSLSWVELTIYSSKTKYTILSMHWNNYIEMKNLLTANIPRDTAKEEKIYKSFW